MVKNGLLDLVNLFCKTQGSSEFKLYDLRTLVLLLSDPIWPPGE